MSRFRITRTTRLILFFTMALVFPGLAKIQAYLGNKLIIPYIVFVAAGIVTAAKIYPAVDRYFNRRLSAICIGLTFLILALSFIFIYPLATSGVIGGGSDRDEALHIAVGELLAGDYPYYAKTYVPGLPHERGLDGNPISPMPGELFFAMPFVLLGNVGWQNFFWLAVFLVVTARFLGRLSAAVTLLWLMLILTPVVPHEIVTAGDMLANGIWIAAFFLLILMESESEHPSDRRLYLFALLFGIGLSSRPNFIFLAPILYFSLVRRLGWKKAGLAAGIGALAFLSVTLPFWLYDPAGFSPLHAYSKIGSYGSVLPNSGLIVIGLTTLATILACLPYATKTLNRVLLGAGVVLALPVFGATMLSSLQKGALSLADTAWYALPALLMVAPVFWEELTQSFQ